MQKKAAKQLGVPNLRNVNDIIVIAPCEDGYFSRKVIVSGDDQGTVKKVEKQTRLLGKKLIDHWKIVNERSCEYIQALAFSKSDLEEINNFIQKKSEMEGFLDLKIKGKKFSLFVFETDASPYEGEWTYTIQVLCQNDPSLNECQGEGPMFITSVKGKWHKQVLKKLNVSIKEKLHNEINSIYSQPSKIWELVKQHSNEYIQALKLFKSDLKTIEDFIQETEGRKGFLDLEIEGKEFSLLTNRICAVSYGDDWTDIVQVVCQNDPSLNTQIGMGARHLTVIPDEWHQKVLKKIKES